MVGDAAVVSIRMKTTFAGGARARVVGEIVGTDLCSLGRVKREERRGERTRPTRYRMVFIRGSWKTHQLEIHDLRASDSREVERNNGGRSKLEPWELHGVVDMGRERA